MKQMVSAVLLIGVLMTGWFLLTDPVPAVALGAEYIETGFEGKTISILGDSISTFYGISNNADINPTLKSNATYYYPQSTVPSFEDTWWQQAVASLDATLLVNNSCSGGRVLDLRSNYSGAYIDRCVQLHNIDGEVPDIIAVYLGINDLTASPGTLGTADEISYDTLIIPEEDGFRYAEPITSCEAYAIILHKMTQRYPDAELYCFTHLPYYGQSANSIERLQQFNASIEQIAAQFNAHIVDLYEDSGIPTTSDFKLYITDNYLHPGVLGMDAITRCFLASLLKNSQYTQIPTYGVSYKLIDAYVNEGTIKTVSAGSPFSCTLTLPEQRILDVTVIMDATDITAACLSGNTITIEQVTGDIVITARGSVPDSEPQNYRWEHTSCALTSVTKYGNTGNQLHPWATHGNYPYNNARFVASSSVLLRHDRPWALEWKAWMDPTEGVSGPFLFAANANSTLADHPYVYSRQNGDFLAMGVLTLGLYHNYGVDLKQYQIDTTVTHTYRLENRLLEDGSNMIYLYIDDQQLGPMNHYWADNEDRGTTENWVSERDFSFRYFGTAKYPITDGQIFYIQAWEGGHTHNYAATVTPPGCAEPGYTTYTCADCGGDYTADYVAATGDHVYENGHCAGCDTTLPVLTLKAPSLEFQNMVKIVAFFTAENTGDVVEMGMITFSEQVSRWDIGNAQFVLPGAVYSQDSGRYYVASQGIPAKGLADEVYLAVYAKLRNGDYVYTKLVSYSAAAYAYNQLEKSTDVRLKQLVAAMLNYGAAAQVCFGYNAHNPANGSMTPEQQALPEAFRWDMAPSVPAVSQDKQGSFLNNGGFSARKPAVSFDGAFSIHYFFTPAYVPAGQITLYYWTQEAFGAVDVVSVENASGSLVMEATENGRYQAVIADIAAKNLSEPVYVAALYTDGANTHTSGVLGYSIAAYCGSLSSQNNAAATLTRATAVYGYHAKKYFG